MPSLGAERSFDEGLVALAEGRWLDATEALRRALALERARPGAALPARFLSFYGLSLAHAGRASGEAVAACRAAVEAEPSQPLYLLNLGRVHRMAGRRAHALECFRRGAALAPGSRPLADELLELERGEQPLRFERRAPRSIARVFGRTRPARRSA